MRNISELNFWPLSAERKAKLAARGKTYADHVSSHSCRTDTKYVGIVHASYSGSFYVKSTVGL